MREIKAIIFDLGNVLVEWNPRHVFNENYFESVEKRDFFLNNICTDAWNGEQDAGRSIVEATLDQIKKFPDWETAIRDYYGRWTEMLKGPIPGSVEIFRQLKKEGKYKLYALTNWGAGLFDIALVRYDFMHWFDGRVVSGEEKIIKPDPRIYQILLERHKVDPVNAVFIDDSLLNVKAAQAMGITGIQFKNPEQLKQELVDLGLL